MTIRYYVQASGGGTDIPITDGQSFTEDISAEFEQGVLVVAFYDSAGAIVTPSAGTVAHAMEAINGQWHGASTGSAPINAADCGPDATYEIPFYNGPAIKGRIELAGIVGADHCRAFFWRQ